MHPSKIKFPPSLTIDHFTIELLSENPNLSSKVKSYFGHLKSVTEESLEELIPLTNCNQEISQIIFCNKCFTDESTVYLNDVAKYSPSTGNSSLMYHLIHKHQMRNLIDSNLENMVKSDRGVFYLNCVLMVAIGNLPANSMNNEGIRQLIECFKFIAKSNNVNLDHINLTSPSHLLNNLLPKVFSWCQNYIIDFIQDPTIGSFWYLFPNTFFKIFFLFPL
jgi:hypothetical protein